MEESKMENMSPGKTNKTSSSSRKHKKRGNKRSNANQVDSWCSEDQTDMSCDPVPGIDYAPMFWQQSAAVGPHVAPMRNGQRLFTTMSDPSFCGYSTVPVAYAMEPVSMPGIYPLYRPSPQPNYRPPRGRPRRNIPQHNPSHSQAHQGISNISGVANGYSSLQENRTSFSTLYQNGDYTSLPPSANNHIVTEGDDLNSEHRRYSDPGLGPADLPPHNNSEDSDSVGSSSSITTIGKNNKLVLSLVEQMTALREANSQMFKQLNETKLSLENVTTELGEIKQHAFSDYQPGMLSDIISEIRQANKTLDETIDARINAIVEEKTRRKLLELDDLKEQLAKMTEQKAKGDRRIAKLEEEVASLKINASNNEGREIAAFEEETLALRRELQEARARNTADNRVAKCVEASSITRSIASLTFNSPCITTSTPVRRNFHELKSSSSIAPVTTSSSTSSDSSPSPLSPSDSSRNLESIGADQLDEDWEWKKGSTQATGTLDRLTEPANHDDKINEKLDSENKESKELIADNNYWKNSRGSITSMRPDQREAFERLLHFHFERNSVTTGQNFHRTAVVRRKSDGTNSFKKISKFPCLRAVSTSSLPSIPDPDPEEKKSEASDGSRPASEAQQKREGIEVPDVVVVPGKSVVPKNLCSTRILTSSVLKAPSRATFTTAYI
ncbi:uncharacterized protein LOC130676687 isoform X1 [Microplitis mediator]|uniref:uncharacterized protein LOC130676687 isoform X1 n=1 Tax=Microplitis mediator TaxID=375433 RepID=UPI0025563112|nr:uncharacterized protein LOC130676687 isoform X1 [Microplitis mediator]